MISKEDAQKRWTEADEVAFAKADAAIEAEINADKGRICADLVGINITPRVQARIEREYAEGGWNVNWRRGDQRDPGPFVELT
jgi:hypothetical protein